MSEYFCVRCGKTTYCSDLDRNLICRDCLEIEVEDILEKEVKKWLK